ncbi:MAG: DUF2157 domain-containing protein [Candidatus Omnitrophota bacterium]
MKKTSAIRWLYQELPSLVREGVLSDDAAQRIKQYYGDVGSKNKIQLALTIFAIIGAIWIGLGIILLFAHNWDMLSRLQRTLLAFLPTIISSGFVCFAVIKNKQSVAMREGFGILNMICVGATISLITQIYNISGDISSFLIAWMLITVPLVYLLSASLPALFYLICITLWAGMSQYEAGQAVLFWPLSAIIMPYYIKNVIKRPNASQWLSAAIFLCYTVAIGLCLEQVLPGLWILVYSAYFAAMYLTGTWWSDKVSSLWTVPFRKLGIIAIVVLAHILSSYWPWENIGWYNYHKSVQYVSWAGLFDYVVLIVAAFFAVYFLIQTVKRRKDFEAAFGAIPIVAVFGLALGGGGKHSHLSGWLFSAYLLSLGVISILTGVRERRLGITNIGILIVAMVIFSRFMEFEIGIITRAVVFIFAGACFLAANVALSKKIKGGENG